MCGGPAKPGLAQTVCAIAQAGLKKIVNVLADG